VQSAYENTLAMMTAYMSGADVTFGTGLLDGSRILALEQIVTDNEISAWSPASCAAWRSRKRRWGRI